jgi:hypothetical protein
VIFSDILLVFYKLVSQTNIILNFDDDFQLGSPTQGTSAPPTPPHTGSEKGHSSAPPSPCAGPEGGKIWKNVKKHKEVRDSALRDSDLEGNEGVLVKTFTNRWKR